MMDTRETLTGILEQCDRHRPQPVNFDPTRSDRLIHAMASCLLELLDRLEALESAAKRRGKTVSK